MIVSFILLFCLIQSANGLSSPITPFTNYDHSIELQTNVSDLWWTVNETNQTILFELHTKTTGWIALGISPAGGMPGADIGVGWVDQNGKVYFQDRHAITTAVPMIDNTTIDWFALQGREENGWTAIQFTRLLDTCDYMDYPIEAGTNYLIFAYGLVDPSLCPPVSDITYHEERRGTCILSLRSYNDPPLESEFAQMDQLEFRLTDYAIPPVGTTYHCKIYKAPTNYTTKRHIVAHEILINSTDPNIIHHLLMYECDPTAQFNDSNLPDDICDNIYGQLSACTVNIATGWAVGGQLLTEFPPEAGYPIGGNFSIKYYLVQMHYNNPQLSTNNTDSSGIRFYVTDILRQYDIGYLTFGTDPDVVSLAIPPQVQNFVVDSYCPMNASAFFPESGINILTAFPHTHLQGQSIWTKIIRNKTAVQYLYDAASYNFNYQFENKLPEPIKLYPGDEFVTRCVYNTMNKNQITLGGESTTNEMCLHMFTYYPRVENISACLTTIYIVSWQHFLNDSTINEGNLVNYVTSINWTSDLAIEWQTFYNDASRITYYGRSTSLNYKYYPKIPEYVDLPQENCTAHGKASNSTDVSAQCGGSSGQGGGNSTLGGGNSTLDGGSSASCQTIFLALLFLPFFIQIITDM